MTRDEITLLPGERLDDLQCESLKLIQRPDAFRFGTDSVLLADFATPRKGEKAVDLGCGTGLELEAYFAVNPEAKVTGIDLCAPMLDALKAANPSVLTSERSRLEAQLDSASSKLGESEKNLGIAEGGEG